MPKDERNWTRSYTHPPEFQEDLKNNFKSQFNDELVTLIPEWRIIQERDEGSVEYHSLLVLWLVIEDSRFKAMSEEDQNTLKWAALLHDISKRK